VEDTIDSKEAGKAENATLEIRVISIFSEVSKEHGVVKSFCRSLALM